MNSTSIKSQLIQQFWNAVSNHSKNLLAPWDLREGVLMIYSIKAIKKAIL